MAKDDYMLFIIGDPDNAKQLEEVAAKSGTDLHVIVFDNLAVMPAVVAQIIQNLHERYFVFLQETFENVETETGGPVKFTHFTEMLREGLSRDEKDYLVVWRALREHEEYSLAVPPESEYGFQKVILKMGDPESVVKRVWHLAVTWTAPR